MTEYEKLQSLPVGTRIRSKQSGRVLIVVGCDTPFNIKSFLDPRHYDSFSEDRKAVVNNFPVYSCISSLTKNWEEAFEVLDEVPPKPLPKRILDIQYQEKEA